MLRALKRSADQLAPRVSRALQAEQRRFLNIHEYQVGNKWIYYVQGFWASQWLNDEKHPE